MNLDEILAAAGKNKPGRRVGRGIGSGHGKTCGRGHNGRGARSGVGQRLGYEGGQNPTLMRIPKRGFNNANFRKEYQIINVASLDRFEAGSRIDAAALQQARLIDDAAKPVKILGQGELSSKLTVVANKFSASAVEKITKAGGSTEEV